MKPEPYRAIVDDAGRALCGWVLSDGRNCLARATHMGTQTRWFLCRSHAEEAREYLKAELVELRKEEDHK